MISFPPGPLFSGSSTLGRRSVRTQRSPARVLMLETSSSRPRGTLCTWVGRSPRAISGPMLTSVSPRRAVARPSARHSQRTVGAPAGASATTTGTHFASHRGCCSWPQWLHCRCFGHLTPGRNTTGLDKKRPPSFDERSDGSGPVSQWGRRATPPRVLGQVVPRRPQVVLRRPLGAVADSSGRPAAGSMSDKTGRKWYPRVVPTTEKTQKRGLRKQENSAICRCFQSAPERIRTSDLRFRRPTLYPAELRARVVTGSPGRRRWFRRGGRW